MGIETSDDVRGLEELQVWRKAHELPVEVCRELLPLLPQHEKYSMTQQLRKAVQSIPANVAEAYGRYHYKDAIRFCYIARGSSDEVLNYVHLCNDLEYFDTSQT